VESWVSGKAHRPPFSGIKNRGGRPTVSWGYSMEKKTNYAPHHGERRQKGNHENDGLDPRERRGHAKKTKGRRHKEGAATGGELKPARVRTTKKKRIYPPPGKSPKCWVWTTRTEKRGKIKGKKWTPTILDNTMQPPLGPRDNGKEGGG